MPKGELETTVGSQWIQSESWHSGGLKKVQLTLSQRKKKKEDEVADDEDDDDAVRTSVSQDRVTVTLCTEALFLSTQYIAIPAYQMVNHVGWGQNMVSQHDTHLAGPAGSHTSQPDLTGSYKVPDKTSYFYTVIL